MPKVKITELDTTGVEYGTNVSHAVYIPDSTQTTSQKPIIVASIKKINTAVPYRYLITDVNGNTTELIESTSNPKALRLAFYLCSYLEMQVVYEGVSDQISVIGDQTTINAAVWDRLSDKNLYDIRFFTTGDLAYFDMNALNLAAKRKDCSYLADHPYTIGSTSGEKLYSLLITQPADWDIVDPTTQKKGCLKYYTKGYSKIASSTIPKFVANKYYDKVSGAQYAEVYVLLTAEPSNWETNYADYYEVKYTQNTDESAVFVQNKYYAQITGLTVPTASAVRTYFEEKYNPVNNDTGKYGACFTPHFIPTAVKSVLNPEETPLYYPASVGYLCAYARSIKNDNPEWLAIGGSFRGTITEIKNGADLQVVFSDADCEILQARAKTEAIELPDDENIGGSQDNVGLAINPISYIRPYGFLVWGNRTMWYRSQPTEAMKASAFLNIRNLVTTIVKRLYEYSRRYTFEQNSDILWINFQSDMEPTLDKMQTGNGIIGYRWLKQATTAKARIKGKLRVIPIEAVEDFDLTVELTDSLEVSE